MFHHEIVGSTIIVENCFSLLWLAVLAGEVYKQAHWQEIKRALSP